MDKAKLKKMRTIQITYPAPYSQSWNTPDTAPVLHKGTIGRAPKISSFFNCPKRSVGSSRAWSQSYSTVRGAESTAQHLKYGMFSKGRMPSNRNLQRHLPLKTTPSSRPGNSNELLSLTKRNISSAKKKPARKAPIPESPVFVFRTVDKKCTRKLSLSEIMHVDITPKTRLSTVAPTFCPSPNFKVLNPTFTVSPLPR